VLSYFFVYGQLFFLLFSPHLHALSCLPSTRPRCTAECSLILPRFFDPPCRSRLSRPTLVTSQKLQTSITDSVETMKSLTHLDPGSPSVLSETMRPFSLFATLLGARVGPLYIFSHWIDGSGMTTTPFSPLCSTPGST
jgi:hypothetical protein